MDRPNLKTTGFVVLVFMAVCLLLPFGCSKEQKASDICDVNLNVNAPELEDRNVMINGGVTAPVKRIQWEWGDGKIEKHRYFPARHTYAAPGQYEVKVTAYSVKGCTEEKTLSVTVK
jgi:hypothetical protein